MSIKAYNAKPWQVKAFLDGRKTMLRIVCKDANPEHTEKLSIAERTCPICPGDILYIRETVWQKVGHYLDVDGETKPSWYKEFKYIATDEKPETGWNYSWAKRPSIHMPKEAARIWLKIKNVRVERLQEITEDGAVQEGVYPSNCRKCTSKMGCDTCPDEGYDEIDNFVEIWNSTIKKSNLDRYGWDANPFVFVLELERCEKPKKYTY